MILGLNRAFRDYLLLTKSPIPGNAHGNLPDSVSIVMCFQLIAEQRFRHRTLIKVLDIPQKQLE